MENYMLKCNDYVRIKGVKVAGVGSEGNIGSTVRLDNFEGDELLPPTLVIFPKNDQADLLDYYNVEKISTPNDTIQEFM